MSVTYRIHWRTAASEYQLTIVARTAMSALAAAEAHSRAAGDFRAIEYALIEAQDGNDAG